MRNISCALTTPSILDQTKKVTRRMGWLKLKAGDMIQPVKKCMGLKPGEKVHKLGPPIRVTSVRREPLSAMVDDPQYGTTECRIEGFAELSPAEFASMFCATHKGCQLDSLVTRIAFEYVLED